MPAATFKWDVFLMAGNRPSRSRAPSSTRHQRQRLVRLPDNIAFDPKGRIWIGSDGANDFDIADGLYAADVDGEGRR
jgi:secreted PhoX family phosphatase